MAAAYGLLVLVFQNTWAEGVLDFTSNGAIITWLPLFLFVVLFGLSMDYHVFVVSRIREAVTGPGMSTREAIAQGITKSAGVVTSAAFVMVGVFAIFATLSPLDFKQMGVGLAAAILIDATIVRAVLLPAADEPARRAELVGTAVVAPASLTRPQLTRSLRPGLTVVGPGRPLTNVSENVSPRKAPAPFGSAYW